MHGMQMQPFEQPEHTRCLCFICSSATPISFRTGVMNLDDYLVRLIKGCLQLGLVSLWGPPGRVHAVCPFSMVLVCLPKGTKNSERSQHVLC